MTNKKRGDFVRDANDVLDPATDLVRVEAVKAKLDELTTAQMVIEKMNADGRRWLVGLVNANGWTNKEAATALGLNVNRVGALMAAKSMILTEEETVLMLERMLLIDVDSSPALGEESPSTVTAMRSKAS